jgi:L-fuconolactonase
MACMDDAGVSQAVLVQAVGAYHYRNEYAADKGVAYPGGLASACRVDPLAEGAAKTLRCWVEDRGAHGVRIFAIARDDASWLSDPRTFPVWDAAASLGIHVIVTIFANQLDELRTMMRRYPGLRVSLDHCGFLPPGALRGTHTRPPGQNGG